MKYEPCARFTTRMTPKISERPLARRNSNAPYDRPLKVCVTQNSSVTGSPRLRLRLARPWSQMQQAPGVLRQDAGTVARGQLESAHDDLPRARRPHVEAEVAADHHAIGADEADEIRERGRRVADRVVREAPQIRLERPLRYALRLRPHLLAVRQPPDEVWHGAARVGKAHLELREPIEHAAEDEVGCRDGRVERVPEEVIEVVAPQTIAGADDGQRMQQ